MACRNSVASEEFADFIAPYFTSPENFMRSQGTDCIDFVNSTLAVVYIPFSTITSFSYTSYTYSAIPKLYSLLDVTSMDAAGITAAGELPVLNNQGEGVLIGFVDTGIHYMDPLFRSADGSTRIIAIASSASPFKIRLMFSTEAPVACADVLYPAFPNAVANAPPIG